MFILLTVLGEVRKFSRDCTPWWPSAFILLYFIIYRYSISAVNLAKIYYKYSPTTKTKMALCSFRHPQQEWLVYGTSWQLFVEWLLSLGRKDFTINIICPFVMSFTFPLRMFDFKYSIMCIQAIVFLSCD